MARPCRQNLRSPPGISCIRASGQSPARLPVHTLSPRVPWAWRRPRVRRFRPSRLVTLRTTKTRPTIPEPAAGAGVCPPRTFRPDVAASSVHEQPFGTPNTLSTSPAKCSQSSSPPFSRTPLAIHSFPCATDAVRLAPATDLQRPSTRRGASASQPRRSGRTGLAGLPARLAAHV